MESLQCPSCGSPELTKLNFDEYKCENCGTKSKLSKDQKSLVIQQGYSCSNCGFINESGTSFCGKCGKKLTKLCDSCGEAVRIELDFCPKCGDKFFEEDGFTGLCDVIVQPLNGQAHLKIEAIKAIRLVKEIGLVEAKNFVEQGGILVSCVSAGKAKELKNQLEKYPVPVIIRPSKGKIELAPQQTQGSVVKSGGGCMTVFIVASTLFLGSVILLIA